MILCSRAFKCLGGVISRLMALVEGAIVVVEVRGLRRGIRKVANLG